MTPANQDELLWDQFVDALTPVGLRMRLQENPPQTLEKALEMALHLERVWAGNEPPQTVPKLGPQLQLVAAAEALPDVAPIPPSLSRRLDQLGIQVECLATRLDALAMSEPAARGPPRLQGRMTPPLEEVSYRSRGRGQNRFPDRSPGR